MALTKWLCTNSTKSQFVKVVHPGGHVELHDRPLVAAEIILRNPKCCVAYPHVFQQPWAILEPEQALLLGHKYYVVPVSTVRKLQRHSARRGAPSPVRDATSGVGNETKSGDLEEDGKGNGFCACLKDSGGGRGGRREAENNNSSDETETRELTRKRSKGSARKKPAAKHRKSFDNWQPNLESINEAIIDEHDKTIHLN